jgi:SseB protein C-terminal domain/SseB protein N-terminal domain
VLTPDAREGPAKTTIGAGTSLALVNWEGPSGPITPIFSSLGRVEEAAHRADRPLGFVELEGAALFALLAQHPREAVLNPGFAYGKQLTPDEIRRLASGMILAAEARTLEKPTQALLGQPAVYPQRLVDALVRLLRDRPSVQAAYLAQIHFAGDPAPHPVIGLVSSDYARDVGEAGLVAKEVGDPSPVDFVDMQKGADDGIPRYLREKTKPFYERAKAKARWRIW